MHPFGDARRRAAAVAGRSIREFFDDGCLQRAAAISYYTLLSLFPLAIVLVAAFGLVFDDEAARRRIIEVMLDNLPLREDGGRGDLEQLLRSVTAASGGFGVVGAGSLLLAASAVMGSVRQALNAAWGVDATRPPLRAKLVDMLLVLATGVVIATSLAMTLAVQFVASVGARIGGPDVLAQVAVELGGRLVPAVLAFIVCWGVFAVVPARPSGLRDTWPGVLVVVLGFELAKGGFSLYLQTAANYGAVYASLGGVVAFLVFIFVAANTFLLGAEVASEWPAVRDGPPPQSDGRPLRARLRRGLRGLVVRLPRRPRP